MKISAVLFCAFLFLIFACDDSRTIKDIVPDPAVVASTNTTGTNTGTGTTGTTNTTGDTKKPACDLIAYKDSLFFLENLKDDIKIEPIVRRKGEYGAYPEGLEINNSNGEINITKSESGLRYDVFFVPEKTTDTCFTKIIISGVDYSSKIYILSKNDKIAIPIYNNNPFLPIPGVNTGKTEFDDGDDDDNGNGIADEPLPGQEVIPQGLDISKLDGKIQLENSLKKGLLGSNFKNGDNKKLKLFYRLEDKSGKSLNKIELEFHFYEKEGDVPKSLKDKIIENQSSYFNPNVGLRYARIFRIFRKPRPPQIVIVGRPVL
jgi:hypothetical protein